MKKPAHRGATAGLSNAFRQVSTERYAPSAPILQEQYLASRFGLPPERARLYAELVFALAEGWNGRRA